MKHEGIHYKGEKNEAYKANAYALKCMYVSLSVLVFCWILDLLDIFIVDIQIMNYATGGAVIICACAFLFAFLVGIDNYLSSYVVMFLLVGMATVICMELAYHTTMFMMFPLVCSAQYFDKRISIFTAIMTCIGCAVAVMLGYRIGLCDANMILLTYTSSAAHLAELASGTFLINTDKSLMFLFFVFPKWLIILALMPLLNHVAKDIQARTVREAKARHQAEIDGLTGVYNRTKYIQEVNNHYSKCGRIGVLFFDINNLKQVNDFRGHEFGDILIKGLTEGIAPYENENCRCYRIGGDEFVLICEGQNEKEINALYHRIGTTLHGKVLDEQIELSIAIGIAFGNGEDIEQIIKEADEDMYSKKAEIKAGTFHY